MPGQELARTNTAAGHTTSPTEALAFPAERSHCTSLHGPTKLGGTSLQSRSLKRQTQFEWSRTTAETEEIGPVAAEALPMFCLKVQATTGLADCRTAMSQPAPMRLLYI